MVVCERCKKVHKGLYGSGRFCSSKCARGFATARNRKQISLKISNKLFEPHRHTNTSCLECGKKIYDLIIDKRKYCSRRCSALSHRHNKAFKEKMKHVMLKRILNGYVPIPRLQTCKRYKHSSPTAGDIVVHGTYELRFCEWADLNGVYFKRNTQSFPYTGVDGLIHSYFPDFKLEDDVYVEIKGYETIVDKLKWEKFPHTLIVLRKAEIRNLYKMSKEDLRLYVYKNFAEVAQR